MSDTFFDDAFRDLKEAGILCEELFTEIPEVIEEERVDPVDVTYQDVDLSVITEETMPVHEALYICLKRMPSIGVNWLAKKCYISKKKIVTYLETGQGLQPVQVASIVGVLQEKAQKIKEFEQHKLERDKALAAL